MICFLTALRHPAVAKDYGKIEAMLRDTLNSAVAMQDPRVRAVVVGHVAPSFPIPDRVDFVQVDFDPPWPKKGSMPIDIVRADKGRKLAIAAAFAAHAYNPAYLGIMDSDDFVSRRLGDFILNAPAGSSWTINTGYAYSPSRGQLFGMKNFHRRCGTSLVYNAAHIEIPTFNPVRPSATVDGMDIEYIKDIYGSHTEYEVYLKRDKKDLRIVPFPAAVYLIETGQNNSRTQAESLPSTGIQPITPELVEEFSLPVALPV